MINDQRYGIINCVIRMGGNCAAAGSAPSAPGGVMTEDLPFYPMPSESRLHPAARLAELQAKCPVTRVRIWNDMQPWLFTRHDDVCAILSDPQVSADSSAPGYPSTSLATVQTRTEFPTFLQMDAPEHIFYRRMVAGGFTTPRAEGYRAEITELVDEALDELLAMQPPLNFVEAFALVVPSRMIGKLLGVPYADHEFFQSRSHTLTSGLSTQQELATATAEMREYLEDLITAKERDPGDDLLSQLIVRHARKGEISHEQVVATARMLLTGGHDTTASMTALGTLILLLHPDQMARLRADRSLLPNAVEEMLRFFTITHIGRRRVAVADIERAGVTVRAGDGIIADHKMANRDPSKFAEPNTFDISRDTAGHVAFGAGPHQCLGQQLARVELQVIFDRLLTRIPNLHLVGGIEDVRWRDEGVVTLGLDEMVVSW
ncbi:cytochrome P450 [Streptomyces sp. NPDC001982]|uniref:cytochrome P450 n=2 Tax=unclassified Streptomyces TaxID=2593676 RepID=UPI0033166E98